MDWLIALLVALSVGGLAFAFSRILLAGADSYAGDYSEITAKQFEDIFLFVSPRRIMEAGWAAAIAVAILVFLLIGSVVDSREGLILALLFAVIFGVIALQTPRVFLAFLKQRRLQRFNLQLVDTLVSMSNALKAGFSIMQAFETVVKDGQDPIAQEFDLFLHQIRLGVSFSDALANLEKRVGSQDLALVVSAIETARKTGGNLTEIFEKIAATIRERMRIENRIRTLTAQGRIQGIIVGIMPVVIGVAMSIVDPSLMQPFVHSLSGVMLMALAAVLVLCGALVIRKIVRIDI